ncbi:hypothetical protein ACTXT7_004869 [Hymenolepis weldensis]
MNKREKDELGGKGKASVLNKDNPGCDRQAKEKPNFFKCNERQELPVPNFRLPLDVGRNDDTNRLN